MRHSPEDSGTLRRRCDAIHLMPIYQEIAKAPAAPVGAEQLVEWFMKNDGFVYDGLSEIKLFGW